VGAERWVLLLRSVNVGGHNRVPMATLRALLGDLGFGEARTLIQSGNAVFSCPQGPPSAAAIEAALAERCGVAVPALLARPAALRGAVEAWPFPDAAEEARYTLILRELPAPAAVAALDPGRSPGDAFAVDGRFVHLCLRSGAARTKLGLDWFERQLGLVGTVRNHRTLRRLVELAEAG
jgi:uncharacterized protein (DUF1697 family)